MKRRDIKKRLVKNSSNILMGVGGFFIGLGACYIWDAAVVSTIAIGLGLIGIGLGFWGLAGSRRTELKIEQYLGK